MSNKMLAAVVFLVKQCSSREAGEVCSLLKRYKYSNILWHHRLSVRKFILEGVSSVEKICVGVDDTQPSETECSSKWQTVAVTEESFECEVIRIVHVT